MQVRSVLCNKPIILYWQANIFLKSVLKCTKRVNILELDIADDNNIDQYRFGIVFSCLGISLFCLVLRQNLQLNSKLSQYYSKSALREIDMGFIKNTGFELEILCWFQYQFNIAQLNQSHL